MQNYIFNANLHITFMQNEHKIGYCLFQRIFPDKTSVISLIASLKFFFRQCNVSFLALGAG